MRQRAATTKTSLGQATATKRMRLWNWVSKYEPKKWSEITKRPSGPDPTEPCPYQRKKNIQKYDKQVHTGEVGEVNESRRWLRLYFRHARDRNYVTLPIVQLDPKTEWSFNFQFDLHRLFFFSLFFKLSFSQSFYIIQYAECSASLGVSQTFCCIP